MSGCADDLPRAPRSDVLIAWGMRGGQLLHVSEVDRGLACDCVCLRCQDRLVAKRGLRRVAHFAHAHVGDCDGGVETLLHRLAKEVFADIKTLALPEYRFSRREHIDRETVDYAALIVPARTVPVSAVRVESQLGQLRPDIMIISGGRELLVEIVVTHPVDSDKLQILRSQERAVLEVRLQAEDALLSREELRTRMASDLSAKRWLFHPWETPHEARFRAEVARTRSRLEQERREHARFLRDALTRAQRPKHAPETSQGQRLSSEVAAWEDFVRRFHASTGRYPTLEESQDHYKQRRGR